MKWICRAVLTLTLATVGWSYVYITNPSNGSPLKWTSTTIPVQIKLGGTPTLSDGSTFETTVQTAMQTWNGNLSSIQFVPQVQAAGAAGDGNHVNEMVFASTIFGNSFDSSTLAVTTVWYAGSHRTEADVIFNTAWGWDSYRDGRTNHPNPGGDATHQFKVDMQRVAIHELGHALGLDHPDEANPPQSVAAIMNSHISDSINTVQSDDITGAQNLYGAPGAVPANDAFANAITITLSGATAQVTGSNVNASKETGEPNHAPGEPGGRSVWWRWVAPGSGSTTVTTQGSSFDTMLAIYTGSSVSALTLIGSNDDVDPPTVPDDPNRNRTSAVTFNAVSGTTYFIAVDGWDGESGVVTLNLAFSGATGTAPAITTQPVSQTVSPGANVTFTAAASGSPVLTYQWQKNSSNIPGATNATLTLNNVQAADAGGYRMVATNSSGSATSNTATLTVTSSNTAPTASFSLSSQRTVGQTITATVTVGDVDGNYSYANLWVNTPGRGWLTIKADNSTVASSSLSAANTVAASAGTVARTFTFTPADGPGSYLFALAAVDTAGAQTYAPNQYITVTSTNTAPTASFSLSSQRTVGQTITATVTVGDVDGNYSYANLWVNTPGRGWLTIKADNSTVASSSLSAANTVAASAGTVARTFTFTPADGPGSYLFALAAVDSAGAQTYAANQYITVTSTNTAPTASFSLSSQRTVGQTITATVTVGDVDGNYSYANLWVNTPGRGWLTIKADNSTVASSSLSAANTVAATAGTVARTFTFTPADGPGSYLFALAAVDSAGAQTFAPNQYITVTAANAAPTASFSLSSQRTVGQTITATVTVGDVDGNYSYANLWVNTPGRGWLTIKADSSTVASSSLSAANTVAAAAGTVARTFTFTPADGPGSYLFALAAVDSAGAQTFAPNQYITVTAANAAPTASFTLSSQRTLGQTITATVTVGDTDGNYSYANLWVNTPGRGWLTIKADNSTVASSSMSAANTVAASAGTVARTFTFTSADGPGSYLFALAAVDSVGAQTFAPNQYITVIPQVLFADDFSTALNTTNWVAQADDSTGASIWATSSGVLTGYYPLTLSAATNTQSFLLLGNALQPTGDWRASFDFTWSQDVGNASLGTAIADFGLWLSTSAKLSLSAGFAGPVASSGARSTINLNVQSWNGTSWSSLSSTTVNLNWTPANWNTATLEKHGTVYHLLINNVEVLQFTDTVLSGTGKLGFHAYGTRTIDDFLLEQL